MRKTKRNSSFLTTGATLIAVSVVLFLYKKKKDNCSCLSSGAYLCLTSSTS
ncbi:LPXTG cell wall anchor domain-containing protein [Enterococcus faecalis]